MHLYKSKIAIQCKIRNPTSNIQCLLSEATLSCQRHTTSFLPCWATGKIFWHAAPSPHKPQLWCPDSWQPLPLIMISDYGAGDHTPSCLRAEKSSSVEEWWIRWQEHHYRVLVGFKPFPHMEWWKLAHCQKSPRDLLCWPSNPSFNLWKEGIVDLIQEMTELVCVAGPCMVNYHMFSNSRTYCDVPSHPLLAWHIHCGPLNYNDPAMLPYLFQFKSCLIYVHETHKSVGN